MAKPGQGRSRAKGGRDKVKEGQVASRDWSKERERKEGRKKEKEEVLREPRAGKWPWGVVTLERTKGKGSVM